MLKNFDIVCISSTDWFDIWGSRQQVMKRLSKYNRILFVESQIGPEHLLKDKRYWAKFKRWYEGIIKVEENIWVWSAPLLFPGRYYSFLLNRIGQIILKIFLKRIISKLDFKNIILWIYQPNCDYLVGKFNEKLSLYYCIDEFAGGIKGRKKNIILNEEKKLMEKVNLVFIHNKGLFNRKSQYNKNSYLMPSAADIEHYQKVFEDNTEIPEDIKMIKKPVIGQIGNFTSKCDVELLYELASSSPDWSFVVIGEVYKSRVNTAKLESLKNFYFLGNKDFKLLPAYQKAIDVCIIPYIVSDETIYISPLKLYEYMAGGRSIVSTPLPECLEYEGIIKIGRTAEEFRTAIREFLNSDNKDIIEKEKAVIRENNWDKRVEEISSIIEKKRLTN